MEKFNVKWAQYALCLFILVAVLYLGMVNPKAPYSGWEEEIGSVPGIGAAGVERIAILASEDCKLRNGADLIGYSDDRQTQTFILSGDAGTLTLSAGLVATGPNSDAGATYRINDNTLITGTLTVVGGATVLGNIADSGAQVRINDPVLITGALQSTGQVTADGLSLSNAMTSTASATIVGLTVSGNVADSGTTLRLNDNTLVTGTLAASGAVTFGDALAVMGNISDQGATLRLNDNTYISGTLGVRNEMTVDGITAAGSVTITGDLDVTGSASYTSLAIDDPMVNTGDSAFRVNDNVQITGTLEVYDPISDLDGDNLYVDDGVIISGTLSIYDPIADIGALFRINDNTSITGTLQTSAGVTIGGGLAVYENLYNQGDVLNINDAVNITGTLSVLGPVNDQGTTFMINDNSLITGTLGVSSQVTADGLKSTNAISSSGLLTVTNWGLFYGVAFMPQYSVAITTNGAINPSNYTLILLSDTGGQATDNVTLNATTSINDGTYLGQLLVIMFVDTDGAGMIIKNGANTKLPGAGDCTLTVNDVLTLFWDGTDWVAISKSDN